MCELSASQSCFPSCFTFAAFSALPGSLVIGNFLTELRPVRRLYVFFGLRYTTFTPLSSQNFQRHCEESFVEAHQGNERRGKQAADPSSVC